MRKGFDSREEDEGRHWGEGGCKGDDEDNIALFGFEICGYGGARVGWLSLSAVGVFFFLRRR